MSPPLWFANFLSYCLQVLLLVLAGTALPALFRLRAPRVLVGLLAGGAADLPDFTPASAVEASVRSYFYSRWDGVDQFSGRIDGRVRGAFLALSAHRRRAAGRNTRSAVVVGPGVGKIVFNSPVRARV